MIGAPHADLGEGVVAVLVAEDSPVEDDTLRAALDTGLARYKHPRRFYWVDELPRNAMGKGTEERAARAVPRRILRMTALDGWRRKLNDAEQRRSSKAR